MENEKIVEAIHHLELVLTTKLATHNEKIDEHCHKLDNLFTRLQRLDRTVYGVGSDTEGLGTRMKILENREEQRKITIWGVGAISVPTFIKATYDFLTSTH